MNLEEIQTAIRTLSTDEVSTLHAWLAEYYHGDIWDRQLEQDQERLGAEEFERRLSSPPPLRDEASVRNMVRLTEVLTLWAVGHISGGKAREILREEGYPGAVWQQVLGVQA